MVLDAVGARVEPVVQYLRDLAPSNNRPLTCRSYAFDLLRWFRVLWSLNVPWHTAIEAEASALVGWFRVAENPQRRRRAPGAPPPGSVNGRTGKSYLRGALPPLACRPGDGDGDSAVMTAAPGTPVDEPHALILSRTMILLVLGSASAMTNFGGAGILNFYALYFLLSFSLSLPLLGAAGQDAHDHRGRARGRHAAAGVRPQGTAHLVDREHHRLVRPDREFSPA